MAAAAPQIEIFRDKAGEWRWRLRAVNGKVIGTSGEGYGEGDEAIAAAVRVKTAFRVAEFQLPDDGDLLPPEVAE